MNTTLPTSLDRFQSQLEEAVRRDRSRTPRRLAMRAGLALTVAFAVALGVLGALPGESPSVVERAAAALRGGDGAILHTIMIGTTTEADGSATAMRVETWQAGSPPYDQLRITSTDGRTVETASVNGVEQLYDPQTNTIYAALLEPVAKKQREGTPAPKPGEAEAKRAAAAKEEGADTGGDVYRAKILGLLDSGRINEAGRSEVDGRDVIRLASDDGHVRLLVDAAGYEPIEWRVTEEGRSAVARFPTYERVPATDANAALLSLTARHPDARVEDSPAAYEPARQRLIPQRG